MSASVTTETLATIAEELREAGRTRVPIEQITARHPELTVLDAYEIQSLNAADRPISGHKIGLTSRAMQEMLGVNEPDYGRLFADELLVSGESIERAALIAPRVEPEIAFVLARDLRGPDVTAADVLAATDYVVPSLEVIDSRIANWKMALTDTVADNASCARAVLGSQRTQPAEVVLAAAAVELRVNGEAVQHGAGAAVLGHPANAVAWLANVLALHGVTLEAGQVILPGSLTGAVPLNVGDHVVADFGPLGTAEVRCS
jgi:2-oxopent-4-enoate hydratase